jgi:hypothetical protein
VPQTAAATAKTHSPHPRSPKKTPRSDEIEAFASRLKPHQRALLPDGATVLERAATQHNLLAASRLYRNIHVDVRVVLLGLFLYCLV